MKTHFIKIVTSEQMIVTKKWRKRTVAPLSSFAQMFINLILKCWTMNPYIHSFKRIIKNQLVDPQRFVVKVGLKPNL